MAELSEAQRRTLYEQGFAVIPGGVPRDLVKAALRALNESLGTVGMHPETLTHLRFKSYCPELTTASPIMDLLHGGDLDAIVESALGPGKVTSTGSAQIALRFPRADDPGDVDLDVSPERLAPMTPHIDGVKRMPKVDLPAPQQIMLRAGDAVLAHYMLGHGIAENVTPDIRYTVYFRLNRADRNEVAGPHMGGDRVTGFSALLGIQLSDLLVPNGGNLTVWPGSHHLYEKYYQDHPDEAAQDFTYPELVQDIWREWDGVMEVEA